MLAMPLKAMLRKCLNMVIAGLTLRGVKEAALRQQMLPICQPCVSTVMMRPVRKPRLMLSRKEMTGL